MEEPLPADRPRIFWKSKRRSANGRSLQPNPGKEGTGEANEQAQEESMKINDTTVTIATAYNEQPDPKANLTEKRKALFEPLEPINGKRSAAEMLLPPPDFEPASYPKGWLVGKKRKLVNVDVVESTRRIAIQEMNRKDREINGLNEQLEEDSRVLELLQKQLSDERKRRAEIEKENSMLHEQVSMLMSMLDENEGFGEEKLHHPIPSIKHHTVQLPVPAITDKKSQGTGFRVPLMSILFIIPFISISFYGLFTPSSCQFSQLQRENLREPVSECP